MRPRHRSLLSALALTCAVQASACNDPAPAGEPANAGEPTPAPTSPDEPKPTAAALPDEGPLPELRTGAQEPERLPPAEAELLAHAEDGAHYYELRLPRAWEDADEVVRVHVASPALAVGAVERVAGETKVLLRVPTSAGGVASSIEGTAFIYANRAEGDRWLALPFSAEGVAKDPAAPELSRRWTEAFGRNLRGEDRPWQARLPSHPWREFAAGRVWAVTTGASTGAGATAAMPMRPRRTELSELMHTTTAATSMQEALQHDRGLRLGLDEGPATVPLAELSPPALEEHPWPRMTAALPDPSAGVPEPLAQATPADFWYVRFDDIRTMLTVLDEADTWITPVAHIMEERAEVRDLSARYQAQLGLRRSGLAKTLGHTVVERVAVMGSDPYLREGSDVTFVFELHNQTVFDTELGRHMAEYRSEVPGIVESSFVHGAHTVTVQGDPTGTVRQHRATVGDLAVVSNSPGAIRAVLDAIDGKGRRLSDEPDLAYMLARDPGEHDGFAFLSDRFIANVVGPRQKVMASRRQRALAELLTPGYAALLYGWLEGRAPADTEALIASGLLDRAELRHGSGDPITFEPGAPARSRWGSPAALTPLIDLGELAMVTEEEHSGYEGFVRGYQDYWRQFIDPVAVRLDLEEGDGGTEAVVDVRVLPLISGTDYGELEEIVGTERVEVPAIDDGLQMVWAVGADSELRRELDRAARLFGGGDEVGLGWLGDWVMAGTLDRKALVDMIALVDDDIQLPAPPRADDDPKEDLILAQHAGRLPVYVAAHVRNPAGLIATLTAARTAVFQAAPGMVEWGEHGKHRDVPIVRVGVAPGAGEFGEYADAIALYYAQAGSAFVLALDPGVLGAVLDRVLDGGGPVRGVEGGPQFVMEARLAEGRASYTAATWALQGQANRTQGASRSAAEILLRGDPGITTPEQLRQRGLAYLGTYPVSASGRSDFTLGPHGAGDPVHGSEVAPAFPQLPVENSPIEALMQRLTGVRASVAFDREPAEMEPPARSLHTHFRVRLGD